MTLKTMKNRMTKICGFALLFLLALGANAQSYKVTSVEVAITNNLPKDLDLEELKTSIDEAAEHPKTRADGKMFYWKGMTYYMLATTYDSLANKYPDAIVVAKESFEDCIKFDDSRRREWAELAQDRGLIWVAIELYNRGYVAYQNQEYDLAITRLNEAIPLMDEENPLLIENNLNKNVLLELIGYSAVANENNDLARETFQQLVDNGYKESAVFASLSQLYMYNGDTAQALKTVTAGRDVFPNDRSLINVELDIYLKQGRSQELIDKLDVAIEEDPGNTIYYFARAISYEGLASSIRTDIENLYKVKPGMPEVEVKEFLGEPKDVTTEGGVRSLNYSHGSVLVNVSSGNVKKVSIKDESLTAIEGYLEKALADYDVIIEIDPSYYDAYYNKGALYQNKVSAMIEEMNAKGIYDPDEVAKYTSKKDALYAKALENFEIVFDNHTEMSNEERVELAKNMKRVYANLNQMDKFAEMKAWIEENE
ncbi:hypothetical protein GYB22_10195 [bacterium]|nr:hypothetical protein [bacterium]